MKRVVSSALAHQSSAHHSSFISPSVNGTRCESNPLTTHSIDMVGLSPYTQWRASRGYAMAGLLVTIGVMGILASILLPVWNQVAKREREAELIFRGEQYARAVELYQRRYVGAYPPDLETLVEQRFLRRMYADPMTEDGEFRVVYFSQMAEVQGEASTASRPGEETDADTDNENDASGLAERIRFDNGEQGGVVGVVSRSEEESLRVYNDREQYNEWAFIYATSATEAGAVAGAGGIQPIQGGPGGARPGVGSGLGGEPFSFGRRNDGSQRPDRSGGRRDIGNRGSIEQIDRRATQPQTGDPRR